MDLLESLYQQYANRISSIYQHLPVIRELTSEVDHITEFSSNVDEGAAIAVLVAEPKTFISYRPKGLETKSLLQLTDTAWITYKEEPSREIAETEFLIIDTFHTYQQLKRELETHHIKVSKYIAIAGTATFGNVGQDGSHPGMRQAIADFIDSEFQWSICHENHSNNGFTILEREDYDTSVDRIYSMAHFDIPDIRWVERFPVGMTHPDKELTQKEIEWQAERLNRALRYGKIIGVERNFTNIQVDNKTVLTSYLVYHIGYKSRPPGK